MPNVNATELDLTKETLQTEDENNSMELRRVPALTQAAFNSAVEGIQTFTWLWMNAELWRKIEEGLKMENISAFQKGCQN